MDNEIKKTLWATADKLCSNMDAAEYKHIVLCFIFLKYISDSLNEHRCGAQSTNLTLNSFKTPKL